MVSTLLPLIHLSRLSKSKYGFVWLVLFSLQRDIVDVNQIFKDLGMLVHEQGEMIGKLVSPVNHSLYSFVLQYI